ncbi:GHKL domain protein [Leptospira weilii str. 2006001853]|uniref:histidine kinase n=2 Tax=Leptospira weilii TaxID=28184 RepID=A0A828Z0W8_9LEPT|nr:ATP-binding protein [Leptospira weilii]EKR63904.1 GHKL domain protein [Leptospira weilii str. 2006001853]EMN44956.1 GHKL domain protein [Leptospira weilii str. LNT 1234]EMN92313.1 GHKL domain protein [Leptospira weilii str. UI 13098]OMI16402.1 histidine kinase [Leptospira weilii serovar Heyan]QDK23441.1 response regulator [Leptospira weilii]
MMNSTDLKQGEYRLIFESLPGLYLILIPDLRIVAVSESYLKATNTKRDEILGRGIFDVFPDNPSDPNADGAGNLYASLSLVLKDKAPNTMAVQKYDVRRPESEGGGFEEKYWSPMNSPIFDEKGEVIYIVHKVEEVTEFVRLKNKGKEQNKLTEELKNLTASMETEIYQRAQEIQNNNKKLLRLNEELTQREREIQEVYKRLFDIDQLKSQFFANVSHELRTPLTLIIGPTRTLLKDQKISATERAFLETIERNSYTLLKHVNDLLDLSKLEAGKMTLRYSNANLSDMIQDIAAHFNSVANERNIDFVLDLPKNFPIQIDVPKMERIILNLISNAFKFVPDSGKIHCTLKAESAMASIYVADNGPGVPVHLRDQIFEKFRQGEEGDSRSFGGTGLGLAIAKEFANLHLGSIGVFDSFLGGALFKVQIPIYAPIHVEEIQQPIETEELIPALMSDINELKKNKIETKGSSTIYNRPKVLIVEDNAEMREYIFNTLSSDFNLWVVSNGQQGLEKAILEKPDVIITDIMMPVMSGDQMVKEIRKIPELSGTYILFLSAKSDQNFRIKLLQEGAQDYLIKPFTPEELSIKVHNFAVLKKTIEALENANRDMESFSYSVSHDLRAPILGIEGFLQIVLEDFSEKMDSEALRLLKTVQKNVIFMDNLIQDLLNFHKISKIDLNTRIVDMNKMVEEVIAAVLQNYPKKNYSFQLNELPNALANGSTLKQVWMNLISNAVKYSSTRERPMIKIGFEEVDGFNVYFVEDNGVGFNKTYSNKLFKVFQRLHTQEEFEGTGVGLAIVARIVQRHGGQVFAEGEVNKGSKFSFTLPKLSENENIYEGIIKI